MGAWKAVGAQVLLGVCLLGLGGTVGKAASPAFQALTPGLTGEYWGPNLAAIPAAPGVPAGAANLTQVDTTVDKANATFPGAFASADNFVVRWTGFVLGPATGAVTFYTNTDDGVELLINGTVNHVDWTDHAPKDNQGVTNMTQGVWYPIRLLFYERGGGAECHLSWSYGAQTRIIIPSTNLNATPPPPPAAPMLSGTVGNLQTTFNSLSWTFGGVGTGFNIYRRTPPAAFPGTPLASVPSTTMTYSDPSANVYNTQYCYVVRSVNGSESANSNEVCLTPVPPPPRISGDNSEGIFGDKCECGVTGAAGIPGWTALAGVLAALMALARRR